MGCVLWTTEDKCFWYHGVPKLIQTTEKTHVVVFPLNSDQNWSPCAKGLQPGKEELCRVQQWPVCHASLIIILSCRGHCSVNGMDSPSADVDVEMERQRLFGGRTGNDVLLLYNLRKCYGGFSKKNTAVENISLGIPRGEVKESLFFPFFIVTLYSEQSLRHTQSVYTV